MERKAEWTELHLPPKELREARLQCHHAVQINTRLARGFVHPEDDDSHTSLAWNSDAEALMGRQFSRLSLGLRLRDLTLLFDGKAFPLDGHSFEEGLAWVGDQLRALGLDSAPLAQPIHFKLDDHPLLHGAQFDAASRVPELAELAHYYANADFLIERVNRPVVCWPHHLDSATLIVDGEKTTGVGMSPGDSSYSEPYFYVSPSPAPSVDRLPELKSRGHWHTEGWVGAALPASVFAGDVLQEALVGSFIDDAVAKVRGEQ